MRSIFATCLALAVWLALSTLGAAQGAKDQGPEKSVFESKQGNVTFLHKKHADREKGDCKVCHPKLFPEAKAPLNYKAAVHKTAEAKKTSCAGCHVAGGTAFESKGNCNKCHVKQAKS